MEGVEGVLEAAAVACPPPGGGPDQLHLFLVLRPGAAAGLPPGQLRARCQAAISAKLNPLFKVRFGLTCFGSGVWAWLQVFLKHLNHLRFVSP